MMDFLLLWWKAGLWNGLHGQTVTSFEADGTGFHHLTVVMGASDAACTSAEVLHLFSIIKQFQFIAAVDATLCLTWDRI